MEATEESLQGYQQLRSGNGVVWQEDRTLLRISGPDATKFLHNFCTANVSELKEGSVCEAFVLDSRGKTISFGHILKFESEILWTAADRSHSSMLTEHFGKYIIREDVQIDDLSMTWTAGLVPNSDESKQAFNTCKKMDEGYIAHAEFASNSSLHLIESSQRIRLSEGLAEATQVSLKSLNMLRLEAGTPWYGTEIDGTNLPQELRRDEQAISFKKGCYLGQETVAKIDAIGHVNRFFVGLRLAINEVPQLPCDIFQQENRVGELRSCAWSPKLNSLLGIGFVKRQMAEIGTTVSLSGKSAEVIALPV